MRALVIEDDDDVRAALRRALLLSGYEVLLAADGAEGLLKAVELAEQGYKGVVVWSGDEPFSAGADLQAMLPGFMMGGVAAINEAEQELRKIPFFVRGKARRNTERYALDRNVLLITVETLYDAKAHFGR